MKSWILGFGLQNSPGKTAGQVALCAALGGLLPLGTAVAAQQQAGSIRGVVFDRDFEAPLFGARVLVVETGVTAETGDQGNFVIPELPPGRYTLVFSKDGYVRQVKTDVVVAGGMLTDVESSLSGEFTEMDEFIVEDVLATGAGSEAALLELRFDSPSLMDSVGADLMSKAGASDAASALRLVSGATVKDGKSAVVRGLPDRYVSSQMNGLRLPTADEDKRAVELDQFPSAVIESVQVSKTFTPDQQGDASGGAVNLKLKGIPDRTTFAISGQLGFNTQVRDRDDFLSYQGGGVSFFGRDDGSRDPQWSKVGQTWSGAVGVDEINAPTEYKWSVATGTNHEFESGVRIGGFASFFYERDASFYDNGQQNSLEVRDFDEGLVPTEILGTFQDGDFYTELYDVTQATQGVQWGGVGTLGLETEDHKFGLTYLYSHTAEDTATLLEDTRGKNYYFDEPGNPYDPSDPDHPGNDPDNVARARYHRSETLTYQERTTGTVQLTGEHLLPFEDWEIGDTFRFFEPKLDWAVASSFASLDEPDKRQFGTAWAPFFGDPNFPGFHGPFTSADAVTIGYYQRTWKKIDEDSKQGRVNLKLPFEQWGGHEGYFKFGMFSDRVDRKFDQEIFSHNVLSGGDPDFYIGGWDDFWSKVYPGEEHFMDDTGTAIDYDGVQKIGAFYGMVDLPVHENVKIITGARVESTEISTVNTPASDQAFYFPPGSVAPIALADNPGGADVDFSQDDLLPSIALVTEPYEDVTVRASFSRTVARQTFKELTPIIQQEYLGGPIFIGDPTLGMSRLENYDLRLDYTPTAGGLLSASVFYKDIEDPIEYVQSGGTFSFTTPKNYEWGKLKGLELEARQHMGDLWESFDGLTLGANATFIDSKTKLIQGEQNALALAGAPMETRDMTNAPDHLYNLFATYDLKATKTQFGVFYNVTGDSLLAGAGISDNEFVPNIYQKQYDSLNVSVTQALGPIFRLKLQAKNLTNPYIEQVYRSQYSGADAIRSTYTKGIDYSVALSAKLSF